MNPHVELVRKWLADPESVSLEELQANADDADAASVALYAFTEDTNTADAAYASAAVYAYAAYAARAAVEAAYAAADPDHIDSLSLVAVSFDGENLLPALDNAGYADRAKRRVQDYDKLIKQGRVM